MTLRLPTLLLVLTLAPALHAAERGRSPVTCYTIGHSRHAMGRFVELLQRHNIGVLADVRSRPASWRAPQFNQQTLQRELTRHGIRYCFFGDRLGGRPEDRRFYDDPARKKKVSYDRLEASAPFRQGLGQLLGLLGGQKVALMCAEENPQRCHRNRLIAPNLIDRGLRVQHIRGTGGLEPFDWSSLGRRSAARRGRSGNN